MTTDRVDAGTTLPDVPGPDVPESPSAPAAERTRSRRSLLGAGVAGLAGLVLGSLGRPLHADASTTGDMVLGVTNDEGALATVVLANSTGTAFEVDQSGTGTAIRGVANNGIGGFFTSANGSGVSGVVANNTRYGVYGANDAATHGTGAAIRANGEHNHGIVATTANAGSFAIKATNTAAGTGASAGHGIRVLAGGAIDGDIDTIGNYPAAGEFSGYNGVTAVSVGSDGYAVYGYSPSGTGVSAECPLGSAVYGYSTGGFGVYSDGPAHVAGNLQVTGTLSKAGGSFKIDHPLDPANKFLYHSFVESPDMLNVYSGTATLDASGEADVALPDWFEALNRDFRYQLTPIGSFSPIYVKRELAAGVFSIAGGASGQKVSWQLTGIRHDAWANANRIPVEQAKSAAERGLYLHPAEHGQPAAKGIDAAKRSTRRHGPKP